jgi:hypothetical protein
MKLDYRIPTAKQTGLSAILVLGAASGAQATIQTFTSGFIVGNEHGTVN